MKRNRNYASALRLGVVLLVAGCATPRPPLAPSEALPERTPVVVKSATLHIRAVGDVMLGTDFPEDRLPPDDGRGLLDAVTGLLRDADITFGNVEGVLQDGGDPGKFCDNPSLCYLFRSPSRFAFTLRDAGFDVVSLANNHARDFGEGGRGATMQALDAAGIAHTGRIGDIASLYVNGYRVAVVAFAPNAGSWSLLDIEGASNLVAGLSIGHDLVIVSFHGGAEGADALHVSPGMEKFYGELRGNLVRFAHAVIDAGADLVIGHGPHVPRALENYRERLVAYSLGNFATHWGISVTGNKGLAPILDVTLAPDGRLLEGRLIATEQRRPDGVFPDREKKVNALMQRLTREDRAGGRLLFDGDRFLPDPSSTN